MSRTKKPLSTNGVFERYKDKAKITARMLDKETVLLEGDSTSLAFLGDLLHACALSKDHEVQFSPKGAGSARFTKESTLGIYVHRLPCPDEQLARGRKSAERQP